MQEIANNRVDQLATEIKDRIGTARSNFIEIGNRLLEAKKILPHGSFGVWLRDEFNWKESTAQKWMQAAANPKSVLFTDLGIGQTAAVMLSAPSTPSTVVDEVVEQARAGKRISVETVREAKERAKALPSTITPNPDAIEPDEDDTPEPLPPAKPTPTPALKSIEPWAAYNDAIDRVVDLVRQAAAAALDLHKIDENSPAFAQWIDAKHWRQFFNDTATTFASRKVVGFASAKDKVRLPDGQPFLYEIDVRRQGGKKAV